jgi:hypothetical protein
MPAKSKQEALLSDAPQVLLYITSNPTIPWVAKANASHIKRLADLVKPAEDYPTEWILNKHTPKQLFQSIAREFKFNQAETTQTSGSGSGSALTTPDTDYFDDIPDELLNDLAERSGHQPPQAAQPTPHTQAVQPTLPSQAVQPTPNSQRGQSVHPTPPAQATPSVHPTAQQSNQHPTPQGGQPVHTDPVQPNPQVQSTPPVIQPIPQDHSSSQVQNTPPVTQQQRFVQPGPAYQARRPQIRPYTQSRPYAPFGQRRIGPPAPLPRRPTNFSSPASFDAARQNRQAGQEPFPSRHLFTSNQRPTPIPVQAHIAGSGSSTPNPGQAHDQTPDSTPFPSQPTQALPQPTQTFPAKPIQAFPPIPVTSTPNRLVPGQYPTSPALQQYRSPQRSSPATTTSGPSTPQVDSQCTSPQVDKLSISHQVLPEAITISLSKLAVRSPAHQPPKLVQNNSHLYRRPGIFMQSARTSQQLHADRLLHTLTRVERVHPELPGLNNRVQSLSPTPEPQPNPPKMPPMTPEQMADL